jgi:hypothetical protein
MEAIGEGGAITVRMSPARARSRARLVVEDTGGPLSRRSRPSSSRPSTRRGPGPRNRPHARPGDPRPARNSSSRWRADPAARPGSRSCSDGEDSG